MDGPRKKNKSEENSAKPDIELLLHGLQKVLKI